MIKAILKTDGGSRGNPGVAGLGFVLFSEDNEILMQGGWYLCRATNNVAEYSALIWGLKNARERGVDTIAVYADSELMVKQMKGEYKVKSPDLKPLYMQAKDLFAQFDTASISHVYRESNKEADLMANEAMDAAGPVGYYAVAWEEQVLNLFSEENGAFFGEVKAASSMLDITENASGAMSEGLSSGTVSAHAGASLTPGLKVEPRDVVADKSIERSIESDKNQKEVESMLKNKPYQGPRKLSGETFEASGGHYEMTIKDHFDASHSLPGYDGPCQYLHGHTWDVEATVAGERLDSVGIVYDFKSLKRDLHAILENFDHRHINDAPPFDVINPTAENLARVIFFELEKTFPSGVFLQEIAIWESPIAKVTFRP